MRDAGQGGHNDNDKSTVVYIHRKDNLGPLRSKMRQTVAARNARHDAAILTELGIELIAQHKNAG